MQQCLEAALASLINWNFLTNWPQTGCSSLRLLVLPGEKGKGAEKTAACRSERLAKYNQLLRVEEELGADAVYAGDSWRHIGW